MKCPKCKQNDMWLDCLTEKEFDDLVDCYDTDIVYRCRNPKCKFFRVLTEREQSIVFYVEDLMERAFKQREIIGSWIR